MRLRLALLATTALAALAGALGCSAAIASRAPTPSEAKAVAKVFDAPPRCLRTRISTVDPHWALVQLKTPLPDGCVEHAFNGISVLRRHAARWKSVYAASDVNCAEIPAPPAVKSDLKIKGC